MAVGVLLLDSTPRRCGWGSVILRAACQRVKQEVKVQRFVASSGFANHASLDLFHKVGF